MLLVFCGFLFYHGLNAGELYRTESLRAIIAAEFLRSGDWIVPRLYGEPLLTKPPGIYAAIALASWPFGDVREWTARLPSALAATATVWLFYFQFRRLFGHRGGLVAAFILPASVLWLDRVPSAEIDMLQVTWVSGSILCFVRALELAETAPQSVQLWLWWPAALLCVAGGFLTKWTAPAFFYLTVIPLLWWRGRVGLLLGRHHLVAAATAAAVCLAWIAAAVASAGWDVFADTVSREALTRLSPSHHPKPYPWLETLAHPLVVLVVTLPWSACAMLTLRRGFSRLWDDRARRLLQALHCWTWPNLLFWSVVPGHAIRNSFPLCPGLAGLAAMVWIGWLDGRLTWPWRRIKPLQILVGFFVLWLATKVLFVQVVQPGRQPERQLRSKAEQIAAHVPEGETLYIFRLKDEGLMFYYGRPVRRLSDPKQLPVTTGCTFCLLTEMEYQNLPLTLAMEEIFALLDAQSNPIHLMKSPSPPP